MAEVLRNLTRVESEQTFVECFNEIKSWNYENISTLSCTEYTFRFPDRDQI